MSYSTASACLPEITRRPYMRAPLTSPSRMIAPTSRKRSCVSASPLDLVDDDACQHGYEDARDLREDREQRGDGERRSVRAQEAEEAHERAPTAVGRASWLLVGHGFVGYGSCSRPCPTCQKGGETRSSPRSARPSAGTLSCSTRTRMPTTTGRSSRSQPRKAISRVAPGGDRRCGRTHRSPRARRCSPAGRRSRRRPRRAVRCRVDGARKVRGPPRGRRESERSCGSPSFSTARSEGSAAPRTSGVEVSTSSGDASTRESSSRTKARARSIPGPEPCWSALGTRSSPTTST